MKIAKLKIEIFQDKNADGTGTFESRRVEEQNYLERECLCIRSRELYFETMPQLVLQFVFLSTTSLWEQGEDLSYFHVNMAL